MKALPAVGLLLLLTAGCVTEPVAQSGSSEAACQQNARPDAIDRATAQAPGACPQHEAREWSIHESEHDRDHVRTSARSGH